MLTYHLKHYIVKQPPWIVLFMLLLKAKYPQDHFLLSEVMIVKFLKRMEQDSLYYKEPLEVWFIVLYTIFSDKWTWSVVMQKLEFQRRKGPQERVVSGQVQTRRSALLLWEHSVNWRKFGLLVNMAFFFFFPPFHLGFSWGFAIIYSMSAKYSLLFFKCGRSGLKVSQ